MLGNEKEEADATEAIEAPSLLMERALVDSRDSRDEVDVVDRAESFLLLLADPGLRIPPRPPLPPLPPLCLLLFLVAVPALLLPLCALLRFALRMFLGVNTNGFTPFATAFTKASPSCCSLLLLLRLPITLFKKDPMFFSTFFNELLSRRTMAIVSFKVTASDSMFTMVRFN